MKKLSENDVYYFLHLGFGKELFFKQHEYELVSFHYMYAYKNDDFFTSGVYCFLVVFNHQSHTLCVNTLFCVVISF